jgi:hypothetical protein
VSGGDRDREAPPAWPTGLDEWWAIVLGLRAGWPDAGTTTEVRPEELPPVLANLDGWALVEEGGEVWLCSTFQFPVFEVAALFVNFLFASIQMTTYPFAYGLSFDDDAEVKVRLSGPTRKALTWGVVLFAGVLRRAFFLARAEPAPAAGGDETS